MHVVALSRRVHGSCGEEKKSEKISSVSDCRCSRRRLYECGSSSCVRGDRHWGAGISGVCRATAAGVLRTTATCLLRAARGLRAACGCRRRGVLPSAVLGWLSRRLWISGRLSRRLWRLASLTCRQGGWLRCKLIDAAQHDRVVLRRFALRACRLMQLQENAGALFKSDRDIHAR